MTQPEALASSRVAYAGSVTTLPFGNMPPALLALIWKVFEEPAGPMLQT